MTEPVPDGAPFETPLAAAADTYAATPPSWSEAVGAMARSSSTVLPLARAAERGLYAGSGAYEQGLAGYFAQGGGEIAMPSVVAPGSIETPTLSASDANERYAPKGPDGKPMALFDRPVPQGVARLIGQAKADELARDQVIARFQGAHGALVDFGTGTAAFLMDPLNAAASVLPGFGEDALAARLGGGFLARLAARSAAGAVGGAAAQAPLTAMRLALTSQEGSDYGLRDAFRDMAFSAAGGAVLQAGVGTLGELLARKPMPARAAMPEDALKDAAAPIVAAPAAERYDALRAAVSQVGDGRAVDVEPVLRAGRAQKGPPRPEDLLQFLAGSGGIKDEGGDLAAMDAARTVPFRGRLVREGGLSLDYAREAAEEAGYLKPGSGTNDLLDAIDESLGGRPVFSARDETAALAWRAAQGGARGEARAAEPFDPNEMFDEADRQERLYRDGYAPGLPAHELAQLEHDTYFPDREELADGTGQGEQLRTEPGKALGAEGGLAKPSDEKAPALSEAQMAALHPDDRAELEAADAHLARAQDLESAAGEAAACLGGAMA